MSPDPRYLAAFDPSNMDSYTVRFNADSPEHARALADGLLSSYPALACEIERRAQEFRERHGVDRVCVNTPRSWRTTSPQAWADEPVCQARPFPSPRPVFDLYGLRIPDSNALLTEWANYIPPVRELVDCP